MHDFVRDTGSFSRHIGRVGLACCVSLAMLLALAGCEKHSSRPPPAPMAAPAPPPAAAKDAIPQTAKLAYRHNLQLEMSAASVEPRYNRAVKDCQQNTALNCVIMNSSINMSDGSEGARPSASLTVRLSHGAVAPFESGLLAPLLGEAAGDAVTRSRSTSAEDLTNAIADVDRRQAQLTDYRDRLTALLGRPDVKVEDLIKIESEISETQSQLDVIAAQQKTLNQRVDTEIVSVSLDARDDLGNVTGPIVLAWHEAGPVLGESTATALRFAIGVLPWLPIVAIGLLLLRLAFRRWRRF